MAVHVDDGYTRIIVGRGARDYAWIMARTPRISPQDYAAHVQRLRELGYDLDDPRPVPHSAAQNLTPAARP